MVQIHWKSAVSIVACIFTSEGNYQCNNVLCIFSGRIHKTALNSRSAGNPLATWEPGIN